MKNHNFNQGQPKFKPRDYDHVKHEGAGVVMWTVIAVALAIITIGVWIFKY